SLLGAALVMTAPGIPMIFQGQEFLEDKDFAFPMGTPLDWNYAERFSGIWAAYHDLITLRKSDPALMDENIQVYHQNNQAKVLAFRRWDPKTAHRLVVLANLGQQSFTDYQIGLPNGGAWYVQFSSDDRKYSEDFGGVPTQRVLRAKTSPYDGF